MADTTPDILPATDDNIALAAERLRAGELVAFPTETVYGLGADATNDDAIASIFEAKGRPKFNPLIIHVSDADMARGIVAFDERAEALAQTFWPGPLSFVLNRLDDSPVSLLAGAGLPTLAVRMPGHPVGRALIEKAGVPVAAPSANKSGSLSPTTPEHVVQGLGGAVGTVLAGGKCAVGLESTVIDLTGDMPVLLRHGAVTQEDIEGLIGEIEIATEGGDAPKSPGQTLKHYAPATPLRLNAVDVKPGEALLAFGNTKFMGIDGGGRAMSLSDEGKFLNLSDAGDLHQAAANLFSMLHKLDEAGAERIAVMAVPDSGLGLAINDRLRRAADAQAEKE